MKMSKYYCKECRDIIERDSDKKWIKSICEPTGKNVRLVKIEFNEKLIEKLCKRYLPNGRDLSTFSKEERLHLEMAFIQGANVMMNLIK